jgi:N-acetylglucosamine-6-phosphate deacetylase
MAAPTTLLANARVVTPAGVLDPGWLRVAGERVDALGSGPAPPGDGSGTHVDDLAGRWVVPGFIDLHVHGGGGAAVGDDPAEVLRAAAFHRRHGTTRTLASLVTGPLDHLRAAVATIADLVEQGPTEHAHILGSHLEGPFISPARRGAHDPRYLLQPDPSALGELLDAGRGTVRMVTIAPELPGALDLVRQVAAAGAIPAIGHTEATYDQAAAAVDAGARVATHLFNAMTAVHHRQPGAAVAALDRPEVVCELINDGVHLHPAAVRLGFAAAGPGRIALITDAIVAAGMPDGPYTLGTLEVEVSGGGARLAGSTVVAGSTLTTGGGFRRTAAAGIPIADTAAAAATTPAGALGIAGRAGALAPGMDADLVVLDEDLTVAAVMALGRWSHRDRLDARAARLPRPPRPS